MQEVESLGQQSSKYKFEIFLTTQFFLLPSKDSTDYIEGQASSLNCSWEKYNALLIVRAQNSRQESHYTSFFNTSRDMIQTSEKCNMH